MSPRPTYNEVTNDLDGAEKGTLTNVIAPLPASLSPNKGTYNLDIKPRPLTSTPPDEKISLKVEPSQPPASKPKPKAKIYSKWIRWTVWFNTYRKLFTFCFSLNMIGIGLAASGVWTYPIHRPAPLVLGNLMMAILMRNEVFGRILYLIVNTLFAKVTLFKFLVWMGPYVYSVATFVVSPWLHFSPPAFGRYPLWLRAFRLYLAIAECHRQFPKSSYHGQLGSNFWYHNELRCNDQCAQCLPMGSQHPS
jgi:hypothetical protein